MECPETFWELNYQLNALILIYRYPYKEDLVDRNVKGDGIVHALRLSKTENV